MSNLVPVAFHGQTLLATTIEGKPFVAVRPVVEAIGLDWKSQYKRIKHHPVLAPSVVVKTTQLPGDTQTREVTFIPLDKLNGWLFGIHASRAKPELRERLIQYQRECFDVLARHFGAAPGRAPALPPTEPKPKTLVNLGPWPDFVGFRTIDLYWLHVIIKRLEQMNDVFERYNLRQSLSALGSPAGYEMQGHLLRARVVASNLSRRFRKEMISARENMRKTGGYYGEIE